MLIDKPAIKFIIPFILGILIGKIFQISPLVLVYVIASINILYFFTRKYIGIIYGIILLYPIIVLLGLLKFQIDFYYREDNRVDNFINQNKLVELKGIIIDQPTKKTNYVQLVIKADSLLTNNGNYKISGNVIITIPSENVTSIDPYKYGQGVRIKSFLLPLTSARNPGDFDMKRYLNANNIFAKMYLEDEGNIVIEESRAGFSIIGLIYSIRSKIARNVENDIGGVEASFLKGILIGDRSEIPLDLKESFINSGVMHILAVSGLHVGIIVLILISLLNIFNLSDRVRFASVSVFLIFYVFLTGSSPSVIRASIMAIVVLGALIYQRKINIYNSLAIAAIIILLFDSRQLFHPGFQLSFTAVISIVALYPKIIKIQDIFPEHIQENGYLKYFIALFAVSFSAAIGTLPFTSYYFGKISIIGLLANLIIVPIMGLTLAFGLIYTIMSFINAALASIVAETTKLFSAILLYFVDMFGSLKYAYLDVSFSFEDGIIYYVLIFLLFSTYIKNFIIRILICMLILLNVYVYKDIFKPNFAEITFLDVGQGDAIFIKSPKQKYILIDAGVKNLYRDAGQRFILPYFKQNNIKKIDLLINTHPHSDHLGGIPTILRNVKVNRIVDAGSKEKSEIYSDYLHLRDSLSIPYSKKYYGDTINIDDNIRLYVLHPGVDILESRNLNNHSLVIKLLYGERSILFTGDIERESEIKISGRYGKFLKSDIIKCAHHGSSTSNSEEFLNIVEPEFAVISVGANNKFNHPSEEVLTHLNNRKIQIYRTDLDGAITYRTNGSYLRMVNWRD